MKINKFIMGNKRSIILGVAFLAILAVFAGVFLYGIESEFNNLKDQLSRISFSVSSLETSTSEFKSSIDGMTQKPDINTAAQSANSELQSKLDEILKNLSELEKKVAALESISKAIQRPTKTAEETITLPDTSIPESSAIDRDQAQSANTANSIKTGQNFTVTVKANEISNLYGYQFNLNYDNKKAIYKGSLKSSISGINTIFKKDMGDHLLVGATMIGDSPGYSGQDVTVCTMEFIATEDLDPSSFTINGISTVDANQNYIEDIGGWSIDVKAE